MADPARYRSMDASGRRSPPVYNPARSSMPLTGGGYNSLYAGDAHAMSASHHETLPYRDEYRTSAVPVSATTYAVRKEPLSRSTSVNDGARVHRITDQNSKRPIIVTTKHHPPGPRSGSPSRDPYRSSDEGNYYALPASSIPRSRAAGHVPFSPTMDEEDIQRLRDRTQQDRIGSRGGDAYRSSRPGPHYAGAHHRSNTLDFDDEGYEYTKPSDLARYDLDHDRPHRVRRENLERYYRPTVSISTDLARPYDQNERRARVGPPPTTWGLDRINRGAAAGIYDGAGSRMPLPPSAPLAPDVRRPNLLDRPRSPPEEHRGASNSRALSLIPDSPNRDGHYDYKYLDDRGYAEPFQDYFLDDNINMRGFGIRVDSNDFEDHHQRPSEKHYHEERRERRDDRKGYSGREPRRRSDEDMEIVRVDTEDRERRRHEIDDRERRRHHDRDYGVDEDDARDRKDTRYPDDDARDRKDTRYPDDEPESKRDKIADKVAASVGLAAASIGLKSAMKGSRDARGEEDPSLRKHREEEADRRRLDEVDSRSRPSRKEPMLGDEDFEIVEHPREREKVRHGDGAEPSRRHGGAAPSSPRDHSSSTDEGKTKTRRRPRASSFNPNNTAELAEMKARLAALKVDDPATEEKDKASRRELSPTKESPPDRRPSPAERRDPDADASAIVPRGDDDDEKALVPPPSRDERQPVRVVAPPPKDLSPLDKKPIKGILKQPKAQFPEEKHPVREGVAPHKDDKTKPNVPTGARWTKISRKMVNPEALKIGKERFEVRDEFVIVLRVLSKEEIQAYAAATATLRGMFLLSLFFGVEVPANALFTYRAPEERV